VSSHRSEPTARAPPLPWETVEMISYLTSSARRRTRKIWTRTSVCLRQRRARNLHQKSAANSVTRSLLALSAPAGRVS
jgi:hypothetical protein